MELQLIQFVGGPWNDQFNAIAPQSMNFPILLFDGPVPPKPPRPRRVGVMKLGGYRFQRVNVKAPTMPPGMVAYVPSYLGIWKAAR